MRGDVASGYSHVGFLLFLSIATSTIGMDKVLRYALRGSSALPLALLYLYRLSTYLRSDSEPMCRTSLWIT